MRHTPGPPPPRYRSLNPAIAGISDRYRNLRVLATALVVLVALSPAAGAQAPAEPRASLTDIEDEVMCPVCGVPLELAIEAPQAQQQRDFIRRLIAQGRTKEEIKAALVAEYGEEVLAVPEDEGFDLVAWLVPGLAFVTAALLISLALRRWRRNQGSTANPEETAAAPDESADAERLDSDLARYDL
jgi:cytochrome c-type biogenesis protein CcmH/NrfF